MNDVPLPVAHGFPVRAIVPGWYGVASVKWLTRILVLSQPFQGHFQTIDYAYWQKIGGLPTRVPITEMLVKASIARPTFREILPAGSMYRVSGAAWAGEAEIAIVEISVNGGKSWDFANHQGHSVPYSWRLWDYEWRVPASPGRYTLMVRATDSRGNKQPMQRDPDRENYMVNHVVPIEVDVR
jgi:DMSO/TMAO reductase YedYZ molybdopterin-dependent catalytic subunit